MARPEVYDVVVAGGGPAGLATAIGAAAAGFSTVVVEERRPPVDRACGEGLMPDGAARLAELGVLLPPGHSMRFDGICYIDGPLRAEGRFPDGRGLGIRRTVLHEAMRDRAERLGVELRWGSRVTGLRPDGIETDRGRVRGRFTVAADGRNSMVRRLAGLERSAPPRRRIGVRRHFAVHPWSTLVEVHWADDCEAYVTPVGDGLVGVALLCEHPVVRFDEWIGRFPELVDRLAGAAAASRDRGAGPFGRRCRRAVRGRLAMVGDAAGSLDPISGEGLSVAFHEARAVVESIAAGGLEGYAKAHRRIRRLPTILTGMLTLAVARPALRRRMMCALSSSGTLFDRLLAIGSRAMTPTILGREGVLSLAWELARRGA